MRLSHRSSFASWCRGSFLTFMLPFFARTSVLRTNFTVLNWCSITYQLLRRAVHIALVFQTMKPKLYQRLAYHCGNDFLTHGGRRFNVYRKSAAPSPPPAPPLPGLIDLWAPIAADNMNSRGAPSPLAIQVYGPTGTMLGGSGSSEMSLETGLHPFNFVAADETGNEAECSVDIFVVACPSAVGVSHYQTS